MTGFPSFRYTLLVLPVWWYLGPCYLQAQPAPLDAPSIIASPKGPNQINLIWPAVRNPGYGYLVEIQSDTDKRYSSWTELQPIPKAGGYQCDSSVVYAGARCTISDPTGVHVYNPPNNGIPYWVTDATYIDPLDGTPAQFLAAGLRPSTKYNFRVRSYAGHPTPVQQGSSRESASAKQPVHSPYSNVASASTANYAARYVSAAGNDRNDGSGPGPSNAWRTLARGSSSIECGQVLIVMGGSYASDTVAMNKQCSSARRAVVMANPGDKVRISSAQLANTVNLQGSYLVVDGIISESSTQRPGGDYDGVVAGHHNALFNMEFHPAVIPSFLQNGIMMSGRNNLLAGSYLHDYNSPDVAQNPSGNSGFPLTLYGAGATHNVIRSNHLTRGGHDTSLCKSGCSYNRWLNNIMDGGWGSGWMVIGMTGPGSPIATSHNLFEGNFIKDSGRLTKAYKPSIEVSYGYNTVRRNIAVNSASRDLEISALYNGDNAVSVLVYNNTFYSPQGCIFQSHNGGVAAYDNDLYVNNICYKVRQLATDMYLGNKNSRISNNAIVFADERGKLQPDQPTIIWNHDAQGSFQYPVTLSRADSAYNPPFSNNKPFSVNPRFVDEANFDFSLQPDSKLIGAGISVNDPDWGSTVGKVDIGAFGMRIATPERR